MFEGAVWTADARPNYEGPKTTLGDILVTPGKVDDAFILPPESLLREKGWIYLKGGKKEERTGRDGFTSYSEGPITFPDAWTGLLEPSSGRGFQDHRASNMS